MTPSVEPSSTAWPRASSRRLRTRATTALLLVLLSACAGCRKSDAERAAEERAEIEQKLRDSNALVPYRALKVSFRSHGEPNAPEEVTALWTTVLATKDLPRKAATAEDAQRIAKAYLDLGIAFYKAKKTLQKRDEDEFPLLWSKWASTSPPPLPGYDAGQEHAFLALVWLVLDNADQGNRLPATEIVFYELSRATPQPSWPPLLRTALRGARGTSFCGAKYHYAAEEELNAFISETEALKVEDFPGFERASARDTRELVLATGHFLRAWNRMGLKRERAAEDDLESGLKSLEKLGIENELTWWTWAFLHYRRQRYEESAKYLDKLALSPYLSEQERKDIQASAGDMRRHGDSVPIFMQARAGLILGQALIARAGGLEHILITLLGPEKAKEIYAPIAWMDRVRQGLGELSPEKLASESGGALDKAREAGSKGLDALRQKLGGGADKTAETGPR